MKSTVPDNSKEAFLNEQTNRGKQQEGKTRDLFKKSLGFLKISSKKLELSKEYFIQRWAQ